MFYNKKHIMWNESILKEVLTKKKTIIHNPHQREKIKDMGSKHYGLWPLKSLWKRKLKIENKDWAKKKRKQR